MHILIQNFTTLNTTLLERLNIFFRYKGIAPRFVDLFAGWIWMISFTLGPL
jgi:hypothetical protein